MENSRPAGAVMIRAGRQEAKEKKYISRTRRRRERNDGEPWGGRDKSTEARAGPGRTESPQISSSLFCSVIHTGRGGPAPGRKGKGTRQRGLGGRDLRVQ